jgi:hypothetical protein
MLHFVGSVPALVLKERHPRFAASTLASTSTVPRPRAAVLLHAYWIHLDADSHKDPRQADSLPHRICALLPTFSALVVF